MTTNNKQAERRAKIIAAQQAREANDRAEGRVPSLPTPRSNWAAPGTSKRISRGPGRPPKSPPPGRSG